MEKWLQNTMLRLMQTPGHALFDQSLADIINEKSDAAAPKPKEPEEAQQTPAPPPRKKPKTAKGAAGNSGDLQNALAEKLASLDE